MESGDSFGGNKKVAVLASGGLSHFVVDEEVNEMMLKAIRDRNKQVLIDLPCYRSPAGTGCAMAFAYWTRLGC